MKRNDRWSTDTPDVRALYDTAEFTTLTEPGGFGDVTGGSAGLGDLVDMPADMDALEEHVTLCEVLDRVLNKGVVVRGDVILSVAGIDLVYLGLDVLLCGAERAYELGYLRPTRIPGAPDVAGDVATGLTAGLTAGASAPGEGPR